MFRSRKVPSTRHQVDGVGGRGGHRFRGARYRRVVVFEFDTYRQDWDEVQGLCDQLPDVDVGSVLVALDALNRQGAGVVTVGVMRPARRRLPECERPWFAETSVGCDGRVVPVGVGNYAGAVAVLQGLLQLVREVHQGQRS